MNGLKWEYFTLTSYHPVDDWPDIVLDAYGQNGWELVGVISATDGIYMAFFKRPWGWTND